MSDQVATFCRHYAVDPNGTRAAKLAGFTQSNAKHQAIRLRKRSTVQAFIAALQHELATGQTVGSVTREWVTDRYRAIAEVRGGDFVTLADDGVSPRWKRLDELTEVQRLAVRSVRLRTIPAESDESGYEITPARTEIAGYDLLNPAEALMALRELDGMDRQLVKVQHDHRHRGQVSSIFRYVASQPATSETSARLRAQHGTGGARVIEHDEGPALADQRTVRPLKGV
jgi:hypothetical protein